MRRALRSIFSDCLSAGHVSDAFQIDLDTVEQLIRLGPIWILKRANKVSTVLHMPGMAPIPIRNHYSRYCTITNVFVLDNVPKQI